MDWLEFRVTVPPELVEPVVELFRRVLKQAPATEEAGGYNPDEGETAPLDNLVTIRAYTRRNRWASGRRARVETGFQLLSMIRPLPPLETHRIRDREWEEAWKEHFQPLRVGQRLVVRIKELEYTPLEGDVVVILDSGMAFGTGHHPTTRMCLEELERRLRPGARVLDIGAGSGILAVAAAGLGATKVLAVEKDPSAVRVARRTTRASGVAGRVRVVRGGHPPEDGSQFDLVMANISAKVLMDLARDLARCLAPAGVLLASGLLEERADAVEQCFLEAGLQVEERRQEEDWVALVCVGAGLEREPPMP